MDLNTAFEDAYNRLENEEDMSIIVSVNLLARITQISCAVGAAEPLPDNRRHTSVAEGRCMLQGVEIC
jgi:hypothetical protein